MARARSTNPPRTRKRVEAETVSTTTASNSLKRAKDGSAFTRCEECKKDVAVVLIDMHSCSQESKLKMKMELQSIERAAEGKKATESRKRVGRPAAPKGKSTKKSTDPNMPKRPPTAYFLFLDDFRKSYKELHPENNKVTVVSKEAGEKWKSMEEEEKKVYLDRAAELKEEYERTVEKLNAENENGEEEVVELDNDEECVPQEEEMETEKGEECIQQEEEVVLEKGEESDQQEEVE